MSKRATVISHHHSSCQPHPIFNGLLLLWYRNTSDFLVYEYISLIIMSWTCFCTVFLVLCVSSISRFPLDLNCIIVRAPSAEHSDIPTMPTNRRKKKKERERRDCVSVSSLFILAGKIKCIVSSEKLRYFVLNNRNLYGFQISLERKTSKNMRRLSCR